MLHRHSASAGYRLEIAAFSHKRKWRDRLLSGGTESSRHARFRNRQTIRASKLIFIENQGWFFSRGACKSATAPTASPKNLVTQGKWPSLTSLVVDDADRHGKVVQRCEGLWFYHAGRGRRRPVRAFFRGPRQRLQIAAGKPKSELRGEAGSKGQTSCKDPAALKTRLVHAALHDA